MQLVEGSLLTKDSVDNITQEIVIDPNTQSTMFPDGQDPIGQVILVGQMPARVIGVVKANSNGFGADQLNVYAPIPPSCAGCWGRTICARSPCG